MSGHSKWSKIKRQKASTDAKRGNIFTKLGNAIAVATKEGGADPDANFKLRLTIDKAKQANMPKQNIERAINRGSSKGGNANIEQLIYEGFGPEKVGVIVEVITDNKNRAVSSLKHIFSKHGGALASNGSVLWKFKQKGVLICSLKKTLTEEDELKLIDTGIEDWETNNNQLIIYTAISDLQNVNNKIKALGFDVNTSELEYIPQETQTIKNPSAWEQFTTVLDENDDVSNYYTNANI